VTVVKLAEGSGATAMVVPGAIEDRANFLWKVTMDRS
jgi:hypothetical protein